MPGVQLFLDPPLVDRMNKFLTNVNRRWRKTVGWDKCHAVSKQMKDCFSNNSQWWLVCRKLSMLNFRPVPKPSQLASCDKKVISLTTTSPLVLFIVWVGTTAVLVLNLAEIYIAHWTLCNNQSSSSSFYWLVVGVFCYTVSKFGNFFLQVKLLTWKYFEIYNYWLHWSEKIFLV